MPLDGGPTALAEEPARVAFERGARTGASDERGRAWRRWLPAITILISLGVSAGLAAAVVQQMSAVVWVPAVGASVATSTWTTAAFKALFFVYVLAILFPSFAFLALRLGWRHCAPASPDTPFVSVIIPAFNEQENISRALEAVAKQSYPYHEVIVVNDGSTDFTKYIVEKQCGTLIDRRRNRGKAHALNEAARRARGTILVFSDSDSFLHPNAVAALVAQFANPRVGAVAGRVAPLHSGTLLGRFQEVEYVFGQDIVKPSQMVSATSVTVCPGPVCAFRRDVLLSVGGFKPRTLTEDFDATLDVVRSGYRAVYEPDAMAFTRCPQTWSELKKQRLRWSRGILQVFGVHEDLFLRRRVGLLGLFWLPYYLISGYGSLVLDGIAIAALPFLFVAAGTPAATLIAGLTGLAVIEAISASMLTLSLVAAGRARPRLVLAAVCLKPYTMFMAYTRLLALIAEVRSAKRRW